MQRIDYNTLISNKNNVIPQVIRFFTTTTLFNTNIEEKLYKEFTEQFFFYLDDLSSHPLSSDTLDRELLHLTKIISLSKPPPHQIVDIIYETIALYDLIVFTHKYRIKGYRLFLILERSLLKSQLKEFFSSGITSQEKLRSQEFLREHHTRYYIFFSKLVNLLSESRFYDHYPCPETREIEKKFEKIYSELFPNYMNSIDLKIPQKIQNDPHLTQNYVKLKTRKLRISIIFYSEIKHELIEYSLILHNSGKKFSITSEDIYETVFLLDQQLIENYNQHLESPWKIAINIIKMMDKNAFRYLFNTLPIFRLIEIADINLRSNQHKEKIIKKIFKGNKFERLLESNQNLTSEEINKKQFNQDQGERDQPKIKRKKRSQLEGTEKKKFFPTKKNTPPLMKDQSGKETMKIGIQEPVSQSNYASESQITDSSNSHGSIIFTPYQLLPATNYDELIKQLRSSEPIVNKISRFQKYLLLTQNSELVIYSYIKDLLQIIQSILQSVAITGKITNFNTGFLLIISKEGLTRWKELFGLPPIIETQFEKYLDESQLKNK